MERAESAQGLLEGGQVKVDYTTGKVRHMMGWDVVDGIDALASRSCFGALESFASLPSPARLGIGY